MSWDGLFHFLQEMVCIILFSVSAMDLGILAFCSL